MHPSAELYEAKWCGYPYGPRWNLATGPKNLVKSQKYQNISNPCWPASAYVCSVGIVYMSELTLKD